MPVKSIVFSIVSLAALACGSGGETSANPEVEALKARVETLEKANAALEKEAVKATAAASAPIAADGGTADSCEAKLAACLARATKCEEDPFTGQKYLVDAPSGGAPPRRAGGE